MVKNGFICKCGILHLFICSDLQNHSKFNLRVKNIYKKMSAC